MKSTPKLLTILLAVSIALALAPTSANAGISAPGWGGNHTFYIGEYSETIKFTTSLIAIRPEITQDMPSPTGIVGVNSGLVDIIFRGTALPGTPGPYTVTLRDPGDNVSENFTMIIAPGPQAIVQPDITKTVSDAPFQLTPYSTNGDGDTISGVDTPTFIYGGGNPAVATINVFGNVTIIGPGSAIFTIDSFATSSYLAAPQKVVNITVNKADPTISANNDTAVLGVAKAVTATLAGAYLAGADSITFTATSGAVSVPVTAAANGSFSFLLSAADINTLGLGPHTFTISQTSTAGNVATNNNAVTNASFTLVVNAVPTYALSIQSGVGGSITTGTSSNYVAGTTINIAANANSGYTFSRWTTTNGGTFANANSANTTFTMPGNATTITASFVQAVRPPSTPPKTGDGFPLWQLLAMMGMCLIGLGFLGYKMRRQRRA